MWNIWGVDSYPWEGGEAVQLLNEAEHLQADRRHHDQEAGREHNQAAELFSWAKYLVHKVFQGRWNLDESNHPKDL